MDNEARPHTCQTPGISLDWALKSSSLCGSGGQESERGTNGKKKVRATGRIPVSASVAWSPPKLAQPPRLHSSTRLTSLHCKSSGVKDSRQKWGGNAAPAILFPTLKNTRFSRVVFGDSVASGGGGSASCQPLAGVSFQVLKRKNQMGRSDGELPLCVGKVYLTVTADG